MDEKDVKHIIEWLQKEHPEMMETALWMKPPEELMAAIEEIRLRYLAGWNN